MLACSKLDGGCELQLEGSSTLFGVVVFEVVAVRCSSAVTNVFAFLFPTDQSMRSVCLLVHVFVRGRSDLA